MSAGIGRVILAVPVFLCRDKGSCSARIVEKANSKGSGWVDYVYLNPETREYEHKTTYCQKEGDLIICCGAYKEYSHEGD